MGNWTKSIEAFKEAQPLMPGGVNSPVRAFKSVGMNPVYMKEGKGAKIKDIDGNEYIDYVLSWGPLILGHANDVVVEELKKQQNWGQVLVLPMNMKRGLPNLSSSVFLQLTLSGWSIRGRRRQ